MLGSLFFDWYACGITESLDNVMTLLGDSYPLGTWEYTKPKQGYLSGSQLLGPDMKPYCTLWWGGGSQGSMIHAFSSGSAANTFASVVRACFPVHRLSRADIAVDFNESGAWVSMHSMAMSLHKGGLVRKFPQYHGQVGQEGVDTPYGAGRTLYLGSRQSVHYVRLYEKGKKDNKKYPDWVRAEVEFKPRGEARYSYASASPAEMLAATALGSELLRILLNDFAVRPCPAGAVRESSDMERSSSALVAQWSPFIRKLLEERFNGDMLACMAFLLGEAA